MAENSDTKKTSCSQAASPKISIFCRDVRTSKIARVPFPNRVLTLTSEASLSVSACFLLLFTG